jgi:hypothetical protein
MTDAAPKPRGYWVASTLGLPLLNAAVGLFAAFEQHSFDVGFSVAGGLLIVELIALWKWLALDGVRSRAWRLLGAGLTIAANTVALGYVLYFALILAVCASGACGD